MMPDFSARMAGSLGLRASKRSATRGKPPVMSRVFEDSCGIRAMTSPTVSYTHLDVYKRQAWYDAFMVRNFALWSITLLALHAIKKTDKHINPKE